MPAYAEQRRIVAAAGALLVRSPRSLLVQSGPGLRLADAGFRVDVRGRAMSSSADRGHLAKPPPPPEPLTAAQARNASTAKLHRRPQPDEARRLAGAATGARAAVGYAGRRGKADGGAVGRRHRNGPGDRVPAPAAGPAATAMARRWRRHRPRADRRRDHAARLSPRPARRGIGGRVGFPSAVEPNGRVGRCTVTQSSGVPELDALTCRLIRAALPSIARAPTAMAGRSPTGRRRARMDPARR